MSHFYIGLFQFYILFINFAYWYVNFTVWKCHFRKFKVLNMNFDNNFVKFSISNKILGTVFDENWLKIGQFVNIDLLCHNLLSSYVALLSLWLSWSLAILPTFCCSIFISKTRLKNGLLLLERSAVNPM